MFERENPWLRREALSVGGAVVDVAADARLEDRLSSVVCPATST